MEYQWTCMSMDWFCWENLAGNHGFSHQICCFPVNFPLNQSIEYGISISPRAPSFFGSARLSGGQLQRCQGWFRGALKDPGFFGGRRWVLW